MEKFLSSATKRDILSPVGCKMYIVRRELYILHVVDR